MSDTDNDGAEVDGSWDLNDPQAQVTVTAAAVYGALRDALAAAGFDPR